MSVRAPVGRLNITLKRIVIGRGLCAIRSKIGHQPLLFQQLKERFRDDDSWRKLRIDIRCDSEPGSSSAALYTTPMPPPPSFSTMR
jgi:hypothetical protein